MDYDLLLRLTQVRPALGNGAETHLVPAAICACLGAALVRLQPILARTFRRMPARARKVLSRLRPRRFYDDEPACAGAPNSTAP